MRVGLLVLFAALLGAFHAHAQPREILKPVPPAQARRLEQYNQVFLQLELYSAARHRIVSVDTRLLLRDEEITITPFPDVKPLVLTLERAQRTDTYVNWFGRIHFDDARYEPLGAKFYAPITMVWWDLNDSGDAELSGSNRFKFSPIWRIDENDKPVLIAKGVVNRATEVGPPPKTPEEIAEHKRLSKLNRQAFGSLSVRLELPTGQTYVVAPLAYTPRYSVVYELDNDKVVPIPLEPGDATTAEERAKVQRYEAFRNGLAIENKAVRGDVE